MRNELTTVTSFQRIKLIFKFSIHLPLLGYILYDVYIQQTKALHYLITFNL
jgi:hypothetical protein